MDRGASVPSEAAQFPKIRGAVILARQPDGRWCGSDLPRRRLQLGGRVAHTGASCAILRGVREPHSQAGYCLIYCLFLGLTVGRLIDSIDLIDRFLED